MPRVPSRRRLAITALPVVLAVSLLPAPVSAVGGITVTSLGDAAADDGVCTLREAIVAANTDTASGAAAGECAAGSGFDLVVFGLAGTVVLGSSLPELTSSMIIEGSGAIAIDGAGHRIVFSHPGSSVTLSNLTLTGGANQYSGAVFNGGSMLITGSRITDNSASAAGGGVLSANDSVLEIRDSTIDHNTSALGGGLFVNGSATVTVVGSTITANTSSGSGGGAAVDGVLTVANSTIAANQAGTGGTGYGGGIYQGGGPTSSVVLLNATITGNSASGGGGGLELNSSATGTLANTIVAGNAAPANADVEGTLDSSVTSILGGSTTGLLDAAGLADNGGPTATVRLVAGAAAAIDQGDAATCAAAPVSGVDQRGVARPAGACDIGAVERDLVAPTTTAGPTLQPSAGTSLSGSKLRARLAWTAADEAGGSGIASHVVQRSVNGGAYATIAMPGSSAAAVALAPRKRYRFRVAPVDHDGNQGAWATMPAVTAALTQQTYSGITWAGRWRTSSASAYSGGSVRRATARKASARFLFTGRGVTFVSTRAPNRGKAKIYINGSLVARIDLGGPTAYRYQAWSRTWASSATRTIKVVVLGTSGRPRVDVDAFIVLQ